MKLICKTQFALTLVFIQLSLVELANALAGGGGGGGGSYGGGSHGKSPMGLIVSILFLAGINSLLLYYRYIKKQDAKKALEFAVVRDPQWDLALLYKRIEPAFYSIQLAWMERDQDRAKDYMTEALYKKQKVLTEAMSSKHEKNIIEELKLTTIEILSVADFVDNEKDKFVARLKGRSIDYIVDEKKQEIKGRRLNTMAEFSQLWTFVRRGNNWLVDEINIQPSLSDIKALDSTVEHATF